MKILFIFHYPLMKGGASKSGLTLVKGLQKIGIKVVAICPEEGTLSEELRKEGISVEISGHRWAYPYFERSVVGAIKFIPKMFIYRYHNRKALNKLTDLAESIRPDIIHSNSGVINIGMKLAKRLNIPHISHFREFGWKDCHAIMCHERAMRRYPLQYGIAIGKEIQKWHTGLGDDNTLIYNGIIASGSSKQSTNKDSYFLYVGGIYKEKGIEDLLQSYSMMSEDIREYHHLKIAGSAVDKKYMEFLRKYTNKIGITDYVEWLGERSDVNELMLKATALIVPSHQEAFGRIVVEAMSNGCIVIGHNTAGIKEQLDNGVFITGKEIGFRYENIEQLTTLMQQIVQQDQSTFEPIIKRSQLTIERLYTTEAYVNNVVEFYNKITDKRT